MRTADEGEWAAKDGSGAHVNSKREASLPCQMAVVSNEDT